MGGVAAGVVVAVVMVGGSCLGVGGVAAAARLAFLNSKARNVANGLPTCSSQARLTSSWDVGGFTQAFALSARPAVNPFPTEITTEPVVAQQRASWTHVLASHFYSRYFSIDIKRIGGHTIRDIGDLWAIPSVSQRTRNSVRQNKRTAALYLMLTMNCRKLGKEILTRF